MRFLYKIHSAYDGFRPAVIPLRMENGRIRLGWRHYIDIVERGWECWVYFRGRHRFEDGVYLVGIVDSIDLETNEVWLRVRDHDTQAPIVHGSDAQVVAQVVAPRYRQVFLWPSERTVAPNCNLAACKGRRCGDCETWSSMSLIERGHARPPERLRWSNYDDVVPAHWIVPRRCYESQIVPEVKDITERFTDFKLGEMAYAYPFALAMYEQLRRRDLLDFDYIVPIPLSPDKAEDGERNRTLELANEIGKLLVVRVHRMLELTYGISKRRMAAAGHTMAQFEQAYAAALRARVPSDARRILLVDDVLTRGSTAAMAVNAIQADAQTNLSLVVATVGQMIVKPVVVQSSGFTPALGWADRA